MAEQKGIQTSFGYLDKSVDSVKAPYGSSKQCENIQLEKGYLEPETIDMENEIEYKQETTMFTDTKTYSVDSGGDIVRSDNSEVGVQPLSWTLAISKEELNIEENELADNFDIIDPYARDIITDTYGIPLIERGLERNHIRVVPFYKIEYNYDTSPEYTWIAILGEDGTYKRYSNDFFERSNQYVNNLPDYDQIDSYLAESDYPYIDNAGTVFVNPIPAGDFDANNWEETNGYPKPIGYSLATLSTLLGSVNKFRIVDIKIYGINVYEAEEDSYFRANEVLYQYNPDDDSSKYITNNAAMPERVLLQNSQIPSEDVLSELEWVDWQLWLNNSASGHDFYINKPDEDEGFIAGNQRYAFTVEQNIPDPYNYDIESIPSDIYNVKVYEYQLNKASVVKISTEDFFEYDTTDDVWVYIGAANTQRTLKIYKQLPNQSQFYLIKTLDLTAIDPNSESYDVKAYKYSNKTDEYHIPVDGDIGYLNIIFRDSSTAEEISQNDILTSYDNYPPDYDPADGSDLGDVSYIVNYQERIFYSIDGYLYFSKAGEPEYYPLNEGAVFNMKSDITGLVVFDELLYIFTKSGIYLLYGAENADFRRWYLKPIDDEINVLPDTAVKCGDYIMFVAKNEGIYMLQGGSFEKVDYPVGYNYSYDTGKAKFVDDRYYIYEYSRITDGNNDTISDAIVFDTRYKGFKTNKYIYDNDTSSEVFSNPIWQANDIDFNDREKLKRITQISIDFEGDIDVEVYKEGSKTTEYTNLTNTNRGWKRIRIDDKPFNYMNILFRLNNSSSHIYDWKIIRFRKGADYGERTS